MIHHCTEHLLTRFYPEHRVGAIYRAAGWYMTTWIPFIWGWVNVFVLVVSSFSYSGGL